MTQKQFNLAFALANSEAILPDDNGCFMGFATKGFAPVVCTIQQVAWLIRWQARQLCGNWDNAALTEIWENRRRFSIVGET